MAKPQAEIALRIEGGAITSVAAFYAEINRVFMAGEAWQLGESLDALNDLLHGGYGAAKGDGPVALFWADMAQSRAALGIQATADWLLAKIAQPGRYQAVLLQAELDALMRGDGQSYFDIVLEIFADHPRFRIVPG